MEASWRERPWCGQDGALCMYVTLSMEWAGPGKRNPKLLSKLTQDKDSIWERLLSLFWRDRQQEDQL